MKWFKYLLLILGFVSLGQQEAKAQIDTTFWFAAPWVTPDHWWRDPIAFEFSTFGNPTTIRLRQPAGTYDTTFVVPANDLFSKDVTHLLNGTFAGSDVLESKPADAILNTGFEITSDYPITVVYDVITRATQHYNPETYSLKGQNGMGYEFVTPFQTKWNNRNLGGDLNGDGTVTQPKQQFSVIATEDNTTVWIKPNCNVVGGHPADVTYSVFLPLAGQVYTCENVTQITNIYGQNMAGSIVVADKPVSVVVTDDSVNPSGGGGCYDLMGDQIVPTDVIGNEYIVNKGFLNAGSDESLFALATENFTTVTVTDDGGSTTVIINQGETYPYSVTDQLTHVITDKPVYLLHMSGYGCELGKAILPPLNCAGSDQVSFARANGQSFLLDITTPAGSEGNFTLNGSTTLVTAAMFNPVPGTGGAWMGAQISFSTAAIPVGTANLISNSTDFFSLGIINGGPSTGCLYHYMSSFVRKVNIDAGPDTTLCSDQNIIDLNGDINGGATTGFWTVVSGTGTFADTNSLVTTYTATASDISSGSLTFVLQSTGNCLPEYDTVVVSYVNSPAVTAGPDQIFCKNNITSIPLTGTLNFAVGSEWDGGVGGSFGDISDLTTDYTPSPTDLMEDSLIITLTSSGSFFSCPNDEDTVIIYFTDPPQVFAGPDIVTCASQDSASLAGAVTGASSTGIWTTSGSGAFSPSETDLITEYLISAADTTAGSVTLVLTSTMNGGCLAVSDSLTLTILDRPQVIITTEDSICANVSTIDLTGFVTAGYSTNWTVDGFGGIVDPSDPSTVYNINPADTISGYIDIYLATSGGICPVEEDSLRITFIAPPTAFAGLDQAFCENEPIPLNGIVGGSGSSGTWTSTGTGSFSPSPSLLTTFYFPSSLDISNGFVDLILTTDAGFGCIADKDTIQITYKDPPLADFNFTTACVGENIFFSDVSTTPTGTIVSWEYDFGDGTGSIADDPIHPFPGSGTYTTTLIVGNSLGCFDTTFKIVSVNPVPTAIINHAYACQGVQIDFSSNSFIVSGSITDYDWDFNDGESTSTEQNPSYTFDLPGIYPVILTVTSDSGCVSTITEDVEVLAGPAADFSFNPSPALALEDVFFYDESAGGPFIDWYWDFGDDEGANAENPVHQYEIGGEYIVYLQVTDTAGCKNAISKPIEIILLPVLPTAFTPNNDGENDVFIIRGGPFEAVNFNIYNNWGELVFTSDAQENGWDGTFKGDIAPMGVYTWTFTVSLAGERIVVKEGDVTLIR